jgi:hypothetical protein
MDASLAKCTMQQGTISEQALCVADGLGKRDEFLDFLDVSNRGTATSNDEAAFSSNFVSLHRHQVEFLKDKMARRVATLLTDDLHEWKSKLRTLECLVTGGTLFNESFVNKEKRFTLENLECVRLHVKSALGVLGRRHMEHERELAANKCLSKEERDPKLDTHFLSKVTHVNIRTSIDGFFDHTTLVLNAEGAPRFAPFVHPNSSVLEASFSQMRSLNRDTPPKSTFLESGQSVRPRASGTWRATKCALQTQWAR